MKLLLNKLFGWDYLYANFLFDNQVYRIRRVGNTYWVKSFYETSSLTKEFIKRRRAFPITEGAAKIIDEVLEQSND